jgi:endonuclease YncB( thermonuclease family)
MSAFGNQSRSDMVRRRQSPWPTLATIAVLILIGARFANQARQQGQQGPQAPPNRAPEEAASQDAAKEPVKVVRVVDGDTLLLEHGVRVRFLGVNTPEIAHDDQPEEPLGQEAKEFTRKFIEGKSIALEYDQERKDDYGRTLAYVYADGRMLNEALIEAGLSEAVTRHPYRPDRKRLFEAAEERAYGKKIGIWGQAGRKPR